MKNEDNKEKDEMTDHEFNLHIETHKINKNHEQRLITEQHNHELYKCGIFVPFVIIIIAIIAGTTYAIFIKNRNGTIQVQGRHGCVDNADAIISEQPSQTNTDLEQQPTKKSKTIEDIVSLINSTNLADALTKIHMNIQDDGDTQRNDKATNHSASHGQYESQQLYDLTKKDTNV